ncbi:hypothetical protein KUCAC02_010595, partial [Chaenocephalus aceratus]
SLSEQPIHSVPNPASAEIIEPLQGMFHIGLGMNTGSAGTKTWPAFSNEFQPLRALGEAARCDWLVLSGTGNDNPITYSQHRDLGHESLLYAWVLSGPNDNMKSSNAAVSPINGSQTEPKPTVINEAGGNTVMVFHRTPGKETELRITSIAPCSGSQPVPGRRVRQ